MRFPEKKLGNEKESPSRRTVGTPGWFLRPVELARFFGKVDEKKAAAAKATQENGKKGSKWRRELVV